MGPFKFPRQSSHGCGKMVTCQEHHGGCGRCCGRFCCHGEQLAQEYPEHARVRGIEGQHECTHGKDLEDSALHEDAPKQEHKEAEQAALP